MGAYFARRLHKGLPAGPVLGVEIDRRRQIVDAGFPLVGSVALFPHPKEIVGDHQAGERGAVLAVCDVAKLLAERLEARVAGGLREGHRNRPVGLGRGGLLGLGGAGPRLRGRGLRLAARAGGLPGSGRKLARPRRLGLGRHQRHRDESRQ